MSQQVFPNQLQWTRVCFQTLSNSTNLNILVSGRVTRALHIALGCGWKCVHTRCNDAPVHAQREPTCRRKLKFEARCLAVSVPLVSCTFIYLAHNTCFCIHVEIHHAVSTTKAWVPKLGVVCISMVFPGADANHLTTAK